MGMGVSECVLACVFSVQYRVVSIAKGMRAYFRSQTSYRFNLEKNNLIMFSQAKMAQRNVTETTQVNTHISADIMTHTIQRTLSHW